MRELVTTAERHPELVTPIARRMRELTGLLFSDQEPLTGIRQAVMAFQLDRQERAVIAQLPQEHFDADDLLRQGKLVELWQTDHIVPMSTPQRRAALLVVLDGLLEMSGEQRRQTCRALKAESVRLACEDSAPRYRLTLEELQRREVATLRYRLAERSDQNTTEAMRKRLCRWDTEQRPLDWFCTPQAPPKPPPVSCCFPVPTCTRGYRIPDHLPAPGEQCGVHLYDHIMYCGQSEYLPPVIEEMPFSDVSCLDSDGDGLPNLLESYSGFLNGEYFTSTGHVSSKDDWSDSLRMPVEP